jgi:solute carrier family 25 carnitine/acylcarnitine transporter 20/29
MTHSEKRKSVLGEFSFALAAGGLYGSTFVLVGNPIDTIKTRMQTTSSLSAVETFKTVWTQQGVRGLYHGALPPLLGSTLYRSAQFAVFEGLYTKCSMKGILQDEIPHTKGTKVATVFSSIVASTCRSIIESPIEYLKVRGQTQRKEAFRAGIGGIRQLYSGFTFQWIRTCGMMTTYFLGVDSLRRNTNLFDTKSGQFLASAGSATLGYWLVWPAETLKNQFQAGTRSSLSLNSIKHMGLLSLYRGIVPGTIFVFVANGCAMIVMQGGQKLISEMGYRN